MCKPKLATLLSPLNRSSIPCGRKSCADSRGTLKRENILCRENIIKRPSSRACCAVLMHAWPHSVSVRYVDPDCQIHSYSRENHEENTSIHTHTYRHRHTHTNSLSLSLSLSVLTTFQRRPPMFLDLYLYLYLYLPPKQSWACRCSFGDKPCPRMCCTGEHIPQGNIF